MGTPKYDKENTTRINLKLNNKTDADIIQKLKAQESIQGYIKRLVRDDIQSSLMHEVSEDLKKIAFAPLPNTKKAAQK